MQRSRVKLLSGSEVNCGAAEVKRGVLGCVWDVLKGNEANGLAVYYLLTWWMYSGPALFTCILNLLVYTALDGQPKP